MKSHYQLLIIGAGPAGLTAASTAAQHGISVALLDEQNQAGGQIFRNIENIAEQQAKLLGEEYLRGKQFIKAFHHSGVDYFPDSQVWSLNSQGQIGILRNDQARLISADQIIVCSGAMERPVPFPGWTLPGVMYAGAGQILFKSAALIPEEGVVLAGSGPLLLLLAWQYMQAGVKIQCILDSTPLLNSVTSLRHFPRALLAAQYIKKGLFYKSELKKAGIKTHYGVSDLQAQGDDSLQKIHYKQFGRHKTIHSKLLLTHFGIIPHIWLTQAAGCQHVWDESQQNWYPQHDKWGNSSIERILVAGDGAGINGARFAEHSGRIAALQSLYTLQQISQQQRDQLAQQSFRAQHQERHIRPFLEAYYRIPKKLLAEADDATIICRCEEINAQQVRASILAEHADSNQIKFLTRCGMGPCQGRQCANAVAHISALCTQQAVAQAGHLRGRPPVTPLSLGQLAGLTTKPES